MKFKLYLIEDRKLEQAKKIIAKRENVDPKYLKFIGHDRYGYWFNITDPKHPEYKSTKLGQI